MNNLTPLQKTLIIHLCDSMLGNDHPIYEAHENLMKRKINLSTEEQEANIFKAVSLFERDFFKSFIFIKKLSEKDKEIVKDVFAYAIVNSNLKDTKSRMGLRTIWNEISSLLE